MFTVTLAAGLVVVAAVALSPLYVADVRLPQRAAPLGAALVAAAVALAVPAALWRSAPRGSLDEVFLVAFVLLLLGALLLLTGRRDDDPGSGGSEEPPWWPGFELDFRSYASRRRPLAPTSSRR